MTRSCSGRRPRPRGLSALTWPALLLAGLAGCIDPTARLQNHDETERERYDVRTVGEVCEVGNVEGLAVGGVGLVVGLDGTGGDSPADDNRAALEKYLRQKGETNVKQILSDPGHALVIVSGRIPAGARPGDPFDLEVSLPRGSQATSLRGGYLSECELFTYEFAGNLSAQAQGTAAVVRGHPVARAAGPLQLSLGRSEGDDEKSRLTKAHVWQGGRSRVPTPLSLVMLPDQQFARVTGLLANRVNETLHGNTPGTPGNAYAKAEGNVAVRLAVPPQYRLNLPHYLRVVRLIPLQDMGDHPAGEGRSKSYRQRLGEDLLDPARTVTAALRLEALGEKSVPTLKTGLESRHPLVRFCAAEALAYLGCPACADVLADAAERQELMRAYALTALASLDENVTRLRLEELVAKGTATETRYGAFRALRTLDEKHPGLRGELLNESFWLHRVAPESAPLVHVAVNRRAEVVLFGEEPRLVPPFSFTAGADYVVRAGEGGEECVVTYVPPRGRPVARSCSLNVGDVLVQLARLGGTYPEAVELLTEAHNCKCLSCPVAVNALPQAPSAEELAASGKGELPTDGRDLGATPTLYENVRPRPAGGRAPSAAARERKPADAGGGAGE